MAARSQPLPRRRRIRKVHGETSETPINAEVRPVAMPADRRARPVFGDQNVLQPVGREAGERGGAPADGKKERRHWLGLRQAAAVEIVAEAERDDAALAEKAVKFELLER